MSKFKIFLVVSAVGVGIYAAVSYGMQGQYLGAVAAFVLSIVVAYGVTRGRDWIFDTGALIATAFGLASVVFDSDATNIPLATAYPMVAVDSVRLTESCTPATPEKTKLQAYLLSVCVTKQNADQIKIIGDLTKGIYLPPTAALVDSAASAREGKPVSQCARAFKAAIKICPYSFGNVSDEQRSALLKAAE